MTKLERLIAELCPNGVEYKALSELAQYSPARISAADMDADNYVGVDNLLPDKNGKGLSGYVPESGMLTRYEPNDILIGNIRPYLKKIWLSDRVGGTNGDVLVIHITVNNLSAEYLYYILSSDRFFVYNMQNAKGAKMPRGNKAAILRYSIPIPPLPIQCEIVRILDNFTELTAELQKELSTELTARKKQYEYYRNELLTFDDDVPMVALSNCCISVADGDHQAPPKVDNGIPFITISNVTNENQIDFSNTRFVPETYYNGLDDKRKARAHDILFTVVGSFGIPVFIDSDMKFAFQRHIAILRPNQKLIISKYLYHTLQSYDFQRQADIVAVGAAQRTITLTALNKMNIPLPSLDEQERIVSILDHFDALTTDIASGLPAEIAARQKQYEYYRDKLLRFDNAIGGN